MKTRELFFYFSLFILSAAVLTLELAQMKLFAFSLQFFVIHIVLSIVLLGFGIGGSLFSILRIKSEEFLTKCASILLFILPVTILATTYYFCIIAPKINIFNPRGFLKLVILVSVLTVPYLIAGLITAIFFTIKIRNIGTTYFYNLIGSAVGCIIVFPLLRSIGMESLILFLCALLFLAYLLFQLSVNQNLFDKKTLGKINIPQGLSVLFGISLLLAMPVSKKIFSAPPDANDQFATIKRELERIENRPVNPSLEFAKWDAAGKIEIYDFPGNYLSLPEPIPLKWYCQDSGAGSILFNFGSDLQNGKRFFEQTIYGFPYSLTNNPKALVIGLGGGVDIQTALYFGAKSVTGIEINKAAVEAVGGPYSDFVGNIYHRDNVKIHVMDGRTFIWKNKEKFDIIQITGADTKNFWSTNALALNINFLYTIESFQDYLNSLNDNGILSITRFEFDLMRLAPIAVATLKKMGIENPEKNILITFQGIWGNIIIKKTPFTDTEIKIIHDKIDQHNTNPDLWADVKWFSVIGFGLNKPYEIKYEPAMLSDTSIENDYLKLFRAAAKNEEKKFLDTTHHNFYPTTDDNPFFFMQVRFKHIFSPQAIYVKIYIIFTLLILIMACIFSVVPLFFINRSGLKTRGAFFLMIYFFMIGVGFMFIEIGLMQLLTRFLGNPGYAVSIVLFAILLFSGIGSYFSERIDKKDTLIKSAISLFFLYLIILVFILNPILNKMIAADMFIRAIVVILILAPIGFALGIPFPSGLSLLKDKGYNFIPWAVGVNGFASVFGSLTFILLVMAAGFKISLICGGAIYLAALLSAVIYIKMVQKNS